LRKKEFINGLQYYFREDEDEDYDDDGETFNGLDG
jgi:hypothetical protein